MSTETVLAEVERERKRQIESEGFTPAHDDTHGLRNIARAASAYVEHYCGRAYLFEPINGHPPSKYGPAAYMTDDAPDIWPWELERWKPKDPRRDLIRAIALLVAEVEVMDRDSRGFAASAPAKFGEK